MAAHAAGSALEELNEKITNATVKREINSPSWAADLTKEELIQLLQIENKKVPIPIAIVHDRYAAIEKPEFEKDDCATKFDPEKLQKTSQSRRKTFCP